MKPHITGLLHPVSQGRSDITRVQPGVFFYWILSVGRQVPHSFVQIFKTIMGSQMDANGDEIVMNPKAERIKNHMIT